MRKMSSHIDILIADIGLECIQDLMAVLMDEEVWWVDFVIATQFGIGYNNKNENSYYWQVQLRDFYLSRMLSKSLDPVWEWSYL